VEAIEAELELGNAEGAAQLVASIEAVPPGLRSPYLGAQAMRFRGRMADASDVAAEGLAAAAARFGELRVPFWQAVALLEHAELTDDEASRAEAREIFEELRATPWLDRVATAVGSGRSAVPA